MRMILSVASFVAALSLGGATLVEAQSTSVNGKIAFVACGPSSIPFTPDQCDVWTMDADGGNPVNLTNTTDITELSPSWSPDGMRIAFFQGYGPQELRLMDADGTNRTAAITTTSAYPYGSTPSWSPGGTQIAFVSNNPGSPVSIQADVVVVDLATGGVTVISRPASFGGALADADEIEPAWSPDGARIAFAAVREETYPDPITGAPQTGAQWEIVTVNPDGSDELIVSAGDRGSERATFLEEDRAPSWAPDGSKIVFMSQAQVPSCCGPWQIWAVSRDGTGITNLTNDPAVNDLFPTWSPDGSQILFTRFDGAGQNLYTMPAPSTLPLAVSAATTAPTAPPAAATGAAVQLTTDGNATDPDWQRDPASVSPPSAFLLRVSVDLAGKGAGGQIASTPRGISCGRDCTESYATGTLVQLTAAPKKGSTFGGWTGACAGAASTCTIAMVDARSVHATFVRAR